MILAGRLASEADVDRFHREARAAAALKHPNIVGVHEVGQHEGHHYFTMDFVDGESLAHVISKGSLAPRRAAELMKTIAESIEYAHQRGVLHRDLKPANILLDANRQPHVTDFGLAKTLVDDASGVDLTTTGQILGTPSYMAPEQASAKHQLVKRSSDVYSLGAILYACLSGRAPFVADSTVDTIRQVIEKEPVSLRLLNGQIPKDLETICLKCLQKEPHRRYVTAAELAEDLQCFLDGRPVTARPISSTAKAWRWARRNPWGASLATLSVLLLLTGTFVSTYFAIQAGQRATAEKVERERADREAAAAKLAQMKTEAAKRDAERQRDSAKLAEAQAEAALVNEAAARTLAENATRRALWQTYVARLQPIRQAWLEKEYGHLSRLLEQYSPAQGEPDFRGWEWDFFADQVQQLAPRVADENLLGGEFLFDHPRNRMFAWKNNRLFIWDFESHAIVKKLSIPVGRWESLTISPDGKLLAIASWKTDVIVWDADSDTLVQELPTLDKTSADKSRAWSTLWSPDGTKLLTASRRGEVRIWNRSDWSLDTILLKPSHRNTMGAMDWHPDSGLVTGHRFGWFRIWDMNARKVLHTGKHQNSIIENLKWSPSGDKFAIAEDGLGIWNADGKRIGEHRNFGLTRAVAWLDDQTVACGGDDQRINVCDVNDPSADQTLRVHSGQVRSLERFNENQIVSGAAGDGVRLVRLDVINPGIASVRAHERNAVEVQWSPDGERLATAGEDQKASVRDADSLQEIFSVRHDDGHRWVSDVDWNNAGNRLATISHTGIVKLWDGSDGTLIKQRRVLGLDHPRLDWRPSSDLIILGGVKPQVIDADTLEPVWTAPENAGSSWMIHMHVSPDGKRAIGNSRSGTVKVVGLDPPSFERGLATQDPGDGAGAWSPDGTRFVAAGTDLSIYDTQTFQRLMRLEGRRGPVGGVCYHPRGSRIASAGHDGQVYLWDTATGDLLVRLPILDQTTLTAINFSPDGSRLATVGRNGELILLGNKNNARRTQPDILPAETPEVELAKLTWAIAKAPNDADRIVARARWHANHLHWTDALADLESFLKLNPQSGWMHCEAACAALLCDRMDDYQRHLKFNLDKLSDWDFSREASTGAYVAEVAAAVPGSIDDLSILLPLASRHGKIDLSKPYEAISLAMVEHRMGNDERVLEILAPFENRGGHHYAELILADALRAHALNQLGRHDEAEAVLNKAEQIVSIAWPEPTPDNPATYGNLKSFVFATLLLNEARSAINQLGGI
ncbi:WD40 repeat domain-containing serine/threonine protein kinase [Aporhodopirellula aestuarii]|uniref:Protein kinase n=1 Tax=Aporhodopirellula aestuarii TaxID=2950107 RepID=A0ABT0U5X9_9BACT|nr:WD40 repeat domain-containing serine/threonine-protein kinase [Aporhodopirellula aestuarii]MCM2372335.1 protein kinase [Aporhodopirellula aestuarii]